jgi:hypothetical protein
MEPWHWLLWGLAALAIIAALFGLDRLCLWLEDRGWLYYRHKKPTSSPASCWVGLQQAIEPAVKHVLQVRQEKRGAEDREAARQRLLALLSETVCATPVSVEGIRLYLTAAQEAGLDWRALYGEAVREELLIRPDRAAVLPSPDDVAPPEG